MHLILTTPGTYLSVSDGLFEVKSNETKTKISPAKVEKVIITEQSLFTGSVIKLCMENNIDFLILKPNGDPVGRFWYSKFGSIATIRRKQLIIMDKEEGLNYAKEWISEKLTQQGEFIRDLAKNRENRYDELMQYAYFLDEKKYKIKELTGKIDEQRSEIMGYEGASSYKYFRAISSCLPENFQFEKRSRQPAKDAFNAFLNYNYGILYSEVERSCIIAGLDPFIGFLHVDNYNKKSLVFDIIENFRYIGDRVVTRLFTKKLVNHDMVDKTKNGVLLNKSGKKLLFEEYNKYNEKIIRYGNRNIKRNFVIQSFCHKFANKLLEK